MRAHPALLLLAPLVWSCARSVQAPAGAVPVIPKPPPSMEELNYHVERDPARLMVNLDNLMLRHQEATDPHLRRDVEEVIGRYVAFNFDALLKELRTGSGRNQVIAAGALGFAGRVHLSPSPVEPRDAVPALIDSLRAEDPRLLANALLSLWLLGDPTTPLGPILPLGGHPDASVRGNAILALGALVAPGRGEEAMVPLTLAAADKDPVVRIHAAQALSRLRTPSAAGHLISLLQDPMGLVRARAALGLAEMKERSALRPLILALAQEQAPVPKDAFARALREITGQDLGADAARWRDWYEKSGAERARDRGR